MLENPWLVWQKRMLDLHCERGEMEWIELHGMEFWDSAMTYDDNMMNLLVLTF